MANFSKRHFITVAGALKSALDDEKAKAHSISEGRAASAGVDAVDRVTDYLGCVFARDNAQFNVEHFKAVVDGRKALNSRP